MPLSSQVAQIERKKRALTRAGLQQNIPKTPTRRFCWNFAIEKKIKWEKGVNYWIALRDPERNSVKYILKFIFFSTARLYQPQRIALQAILWKGEISLYFNYTFSIFTRLYFSGYIGTIDTPTTQEKNIHEIMPVTIWLVILKIMSFYSLFLTTYNSRYMIYSANNNCQLMLNDTRFILKFKIQT